MAKMNSEQLAKEPMCADCGGWDIEWMHRCHKHKSIQFCRGCECPCCAEEYDEDAEAFYEGDEERT